MYTKETLENILDLLPEYIFFKDRDGKNIYCNKTYEKLEITKNIPGIDKIKDEEVFKNKQPIIFESEIIKLNGEKVNVEVQKYPLFDKHKNITGILGIIKDISYKEELDRLRDGFFSNINHEFRTPLNMILSNVQLLEHKCSKCSDNHRSSCNNCFIQNIKQIYNNSLRLLKLSNNLIDITNLQVGGFVFNPRNYDLVNCVENICESINSYKQFKNINIIFDTDIEELIVNFDYLKLERVIMNLISNAIKFNKDNGSIFISITHNNNVVKISIKDTGIGIEESNLEKIFTTFYNVEERLTKISEGSGVGLALCKKLIDMHRGSIKVKSEIGVGSEFIVSIPNIYDEYEDIDKTYLKIDESSLYRIYMELSDIYDS